MAKKISMVVKLKIPRGEPITNIQLNSHAIKLTSKFIAL